MIRRTGLWIALTCFLLLPVFPAQADEPAVSAVLFYNPDCGQCTHVMNAVLPPLIVKSTIKTC